MNINTTVAFAYVTGDVSNTVETLVDFGFTAAQVNAAARCRITAVANALRYRYDGGNPTTSAGHILVANAETEIIGANNIAKLRLIRNSSSDVTLSITLEG